jgi:hypothetical protein
MGVQSKDNTMTKVSWPAVILGAYTLCVHIAPWFAVAGFVIIAFMVMMISPRG